LAIKGPLFHSDITVPSAISSRLTILNILFDSHCHLDDRTFLKDLEGTLQNARDAGVCEMLTVGVDLESSRRAVELAESNSGVYASIGVHPHDAKSCDDSVITALSRLAGKKVVRAWGEIGLDFNRMYSPRENQEKWLVRQIQAADNLGLPLIFHERDSQGRFLEILKSQFNPKNKRGRALLQWKQG
jgi:TatD DNase family protein